MESVSKINRDLEEIKYILKNRTVDVLYQPVVSLKNGEVLGYYIKSRGPQNTMLFDLEKYYKEVKEHKLLWEIDSITRLKAIKNDGDRLTGKKLFMDITPDMLEDSWFSICFNNELLSEYNIRIDELVFKITENSSIKEYRIVEKVLEGFSDLALYTNTFPKYIKLDADLIKDIDKSVANQSLIRMIKEFSYMNGSKIIAEGIQTENELKALMDLEIDYGQGNLIQPISEGIIPIKREILEIIKEYNKRLEKIKLEGFGEYCIGFLARKDKPVDIATSIEKVNEIFSEEYYLQGIVVVKEDVPVGLVMRNKFYYQLLRRKLQDLGSKSVDAVMTKLPLIVDYYAPVSKVTKIALSRREESVYDYIIVSKNSKYYGIVSMRKIFEVIGKGCR